MFNYLHFPNMSIQTYIIYNLNNIEVYEKPVSHTKKIHHCTIIIETGEENTICESLYCCGSNLFVRHRSISHHNGLITSNFLSNTDLLNFPVELRYLVGYTGIWRCISFSAAIVYRRHLVSETRHKRLHYGPPERWHEGKVKERVRRRINHWHKNIDFLKNKTYPEITRFAVLHSVWSVFHWEL